MLNPLLKIYQKYYIMIEPEFDYFIVNEIFNDIARDAVSVSNY